MIEKALPCASWLLAGCLFSQVALGDTTRGEVGFTLDAFVPELSGKTVTVSITNDASFAPVTATVSTNGYLNATVTGRIDTKGLIMQQLALKFKDQTRPYPSSTAANLFVADNGATKWCSYFPPSDDLTECWVVFTNAVAARPTRLELVGADDTVRAKGRNWARWTLFGWNGTSWDVIHKWGAGTEPPAMTKGTISCYDFPFTNKMAYSEFKLAVDAVAHADESMGGKWLQQMAEVRLYEDVLKSNGEEDGQLEIGWKIESAGKAQVLMRKQTVSTVPYALASANAMHVESREPIILSGELTVSGDLQATTIEALNVGAPIAATSEAGIILRPPANQKFALDVGDLELRSDKATPFPCVECKGVVAEGAVGAPKSNRWVSVKHEATAYGFVQIDLNFTRNGADWNPSSKELSANIALALIGIFHRNTKTESPLNMIFSPLDNGRWADDLMPHGNYGRMRPLFSGAIPDRSWSLMVPVSPGEEIEVLTEFVRITRQVGPPNIFHVYARSRELLSSTLTTTLTFHQIAHPKEVGK